MNRQLFWLAMLLGAISTSGSMLFASSLVFGLVNETGNQITTVEQVEKPKELTFAVCDSQKVPVEFLKVQDEGQQIFVVKGPSVSENRECLLVNADFLSKRKILRIERSKQSYADDGTVTMPGCDSQLTKGAAQIKERPISNCWHLASLQDASVDLVEFKKSGKSLLASLEFEWRDGCLGFSI